MSLKINPELITDDMMYEGNVEPLDYVALQRITKEMSEQRVSDHVQRVLEDKLWGEIRRAAKTNKPLQDALERAIIIYQLSKDNGTK
jgi:ribosomal protein S3AE